MLYRTENTEGQRWTICGSHTWFRGLHGNKIAIDGLEGLLAVGNQLWYGSTHIVYACTYLGQLVEVVLVEVILVRLAEVVLVGVILVQLAEVVLVEVVLVQLAEVVLVWVILVQLAEVVLVEVALARLVEVALARLVEVVLVQEDHLVQKTNGVHISYSYM